MGNPGQVRMKVMPPARASKAKHRTGRDGDRALRQAGAETYGVTPQVAPKAKSGKLSPQDCTTEQLFEIVIDVAQRFRTARDVVAEHRDYIVRLKTDVFKVRFGSVGVRVPVGWNGREGFPATMRMTWKEFCETQFGVSADWINRVCGGKAEGPGERTTIEGVKRLTLDSRQQTALVSAQVAVNDLVAALKAGADWRAPLANYEKVAVPPTMLDKFINASVPEPDWKATLTSLLNTLEPCSDTLPIEAKAAVHAAQTMLAPEDFTGQTANRSASPRTMRTCPVGPATTSAPASISTNEREALRNGRCSQARVEVAGTLGERDSQMESWVGKIHCGDCLKLMEKMPPRSVDLIVTSSPYNLRTSTGNGMKDARGGKWRSAALLDGYDGFDDAMPYDQYVKWQRECLTAMMRLLREDGAVFYNHKWRVQNGLLQDRSEIVEGFPVRQIIIWRRQGGINFNAGYFLPTYEVIYLICKREFRLASKLAVRLGDVWEIPQDRSTNAHPAPYPVELPKRCIRSTTAKIVLDPFLGSGTTAIASEDCGRQWIGIERSQDYCAYAQERIEAHRRLP